MLFTYQRRVQRFLRDTRTLVVNPDNIKDYINEARAQLAGESECLRVMGSLTLAAGTNLYPFSSISLGAASGIGGILNVRAMWYVVASGQKWMRPRPFEWFSLYELNNPVPQQGPPKLWSQYAQGSTGSLYVSPIPDQAYTVPADCTCYPVDLVDDTTVEAIPKLWTYAIPYYATYLAMMEMETGGDTGAAEKMFAKYKEYVIRARRGATPSVMPSIYSQIPSTTRADQQPNGDQG
jgi:hypothetical protein